MVGLSTVSWSFHDSFILLVSFFLCLVLVVIGLKVPRLSGEQGNLQARQASHIVPTPRVGGVAIFGALIVTILYSPPELSAPYTQFVLASSPLFIIGLAEDLGFGMSPKRRLLASVFSSLLVIGLLEVWMPRSGIAWLDPFMSAVAVGVPITLFVTAGLSNAFNLVDGVNGLAGLCAGAAALAIGVISAKGGYDHMVHLSMMLFAAIGGFLLVNFPRGMIFLGDAGAYTLGFVLSWFCISILITVPDASPWALLLTVFWPVADTCLAIYRRIKHRQNVAKPDRLHAHQMVMRSLEVYVLGRHRRETSNPLTTVILSPFVLAPPAISVFVWDSNIYAFFAVASFTILFFSSYIGCFLLLKRLTPLSGCKQKRTQQLLPLRLK